VTLYAEKATVGSHAGRPLLLRTTGLPSVEGSGTPSPRSARDMMRQHDAAINSKCVMDDTLFVLGTNFVCIGNKLRKNETTGPDLQTAKPGDQARRSGSQRM
jgi:hypothetical protein